MVSHKYARSGYFVLLCIMSNEGDGNKMSIILRSGRVHCTRRGAVTEF